MVFVSMRNMRLSRTQLEIDRNDTTLIKARRRTRRTICACFFSLTVPWFVFGLSEYVEFTFLRRNTVVNDVTFDSIEVMPRQNSETTVGKEGWERASKFDGLPGGIDSITKIDHRPQENIINTVNIQMDVQIQMVIARNPACKGKERFLRIFLASANNMHPRSITTEFCEKLPGQEQINALFGPRPIIFGLETCQAYRELLLPHNNNGTTLIAAPRVAGLFNTGTNALEVAFQLNLIRKNLRSSLRTRNSPHDVPWGKHMPPALLRLNNTLPGENGDNRFRVLPVVLIRDPFFWMQSMCKEWYDLKWNKPNDRRCPSIIKFQSNMTTYNIFARYMQANQLRQDYKSLPDLWSDWNRQYLDADYPRLIIRYEDILYRMDEVIDAIRNCTGLHRSNKSFRQQLRKSKLHGDASDFLSSLQKHLINDGRHRGLTRFDRIYANSALDPQLMQLFRYDYAPLDVQSTDLIGPFAGHNKYLYLRNKWWPLDQ